jgi:pimeloyl-ACP methyl ester carboxylesterase
MKRLLLLLVLATSLDCVAQQYDSIEQQWCDSVYRATDLLVRDSMILQDDLCMPLFWTVYGQEPADGRSLWISLHGGGGTTSEVNNGQWRNQMYLYRPAEGVYVSPRAPWDAWDMWFQAPIDSMYLQIIRAMVTHFNVNPDKVYIMGYSAGGDGVWRMAPRMADRWAAASMMAGHPGDVSLVNLRNLPFMIWMGGRDAAYNRNREAAIRGAQMDSLQAQDPEGYVHETHILPDKAHWMDREDRAALPWMAKYRRNPWPKHLVWQQESVLKEHFYWVSVPRNEMQRGKRVEISVKGNTIDILRCDYSRLTLRLSSELLPLTGKVKVRWAGKTLFKGRPQPSEGTFRKTLHQMQDPRMAAPVEITVTKKRGE